MARFSIFGNSLFRHWPMSEKNITKNERHLSLVAHSFTKLSQNVCLINTHILIYWHARCDCKLWKLLWFYCVFFWVFSYIIDEYSCLKYCIFTKHSQIVCLINVYILEYQHAKYDCWLWQVFYFAFFKNFSYNYYKFETI